MMRSFFPIRTWYLRILSNPCNLLRISSIFVFLSRAFAGTCGKALKDFILLLICISRKISDTVFSVWNVIQHNLAFLVIENVIFKMSSLWGWMPVALYILFSWR